MKYESLSLIALIGLTSAAPTPVAKNVFSIPRAMLRGREVPQEHSHNRFLDGVRVNLNINNPAGIQDPIFGLLGNAAAAAGAGTITNLDCLHQATADQAFTNAKAAGNVTGQSDALLYAALERNTGSVGLASVICNETAVNPEIQAVQQHQDPASAGAAATNKAVVLALAQQLASIGADPQEALLSGTFAPGNVSFHHLVRDTCANRTRSTIPLTLETLVILPMMSRVAFSPRTFWLMMRQPMKSALLWLVVLQRLWRATLLPLLSLLAPQAMLPLLQELAQQRRPQRLRQRQRQRQRHPQRLRQKQRHRQRHPQRHLQATLRPPLLLEVSTSNIHVNLARINNCSANVQIFTGTLGGAPPPVISSAGDRPFSVNGNTFVNAGAALQRSCSVSTSA
jgi:hypothetical protein